ncbi:MAG TPA: hypothetical protein VGK23_06600 [Methanomassiliicoccales archaeon]|jgi:hypothetical protein
MVDHEKVSLEISRETRDRLLAVMKTLHTTDMETFLNDLLEGIETHGRRHRVQSYEVVERLFTATCPIKEHKIIQGEGERCEYCGEILLDQGKTICTYCGSREIHFMASCPRHKSGVNVVDCSKCESGVVDPGKKAVTCRFLG